MIFNDTTSSLPKLLENIKLMSFVWLKAKFASIAFGYHNQNLNTLMCLSIG